MSPVLPVPLTPRPAATGRIGYTVPPELRRLRAAWSVVGTTTRRTIRMTADCPILTEEQQPDGTWMMTGRTTHGAGVSICLRADALVVIRYGDRPDMASIKLPAPLCRTIPASHARHPGGRA